jgi:REP element-mobilizing transposase RayT
LIFSTKNRERVLTDRVREPLHAYMATVLRNLGCHIHLVNSVEDHVHILFDLARNLSMSKAVEEVKKASSKWLKTQGPDLVNFAWQAGYGAFSVSESNLAGVRDYVAKQREHHLRKTFQDEFRAFLLRHRINFDEHYLWD